MTSSKPSLRDAQKSLTRNRLLDAAVAVLSNSLTLDATMDEIAKEAGVTRVTLYAHFANKSEIIRGLAERMYTRGDKVYSALAAMPRWTPVTIRDWLEDIESKWRAGAAGIRVLAAAGTAMLGDSNLNPHERYIAILTANPVRWEGVPDQEARQRCLMFILAIEGFFTAWIAAGWTAGPEDPLELFCDSLCYMLGPAIEVESADAMKEMRRRDRDV